MATVTIWCQTCGTTFWYGAPGYPGHGYGEDGYLPCDKQAPSCYRCTPDPEEYR
jgi:hypothetical protein